MLALMLSYCHECPFLYELIIRPYFDHTTGIYKSCKSKPFLFSLHPKQWIQDREKNVSEKVKKLKIFVPKMFTVVLKIPCKIPSPICENVVDFFSV